MNRAQSITHRLVPAALLAVALGLFASAVRADVPPTAPQVLELGKGPTIVIVHSLGGSRMTWMPTVKRLMGSYHVVLADLPGHGQSPLPDPFTLDAVAQALDLLLARQNPDSTVLVGHGLGGQLLVLDLKSHPQRARGLVLLDTGLKSPVKIEDSEQIKWFSQILDERYDDFMKMYYAQAGRDSAEGVRIRAMGMQTPPASMKAYLRALFTSDAGSAFASLRIPVLFIGTDRLFKERMQASSLSTRPGYADSVAARTHGKPPEEPKERDWATLGKDLGYPDPAAVPLWRIKDSGSLVMQDQPDSLAAVISRFAAKVLGTKK